jgi:hypothetical protein
LATAQALQQARTVRNEPAGYGDLNVTLTVRGVGITFGLQQEILRDSADGPVRPYVGFAIGNSGVSATVSPNQSEVGLYLGASGFVGVGGQVGVGLTTKGVDPFVEGGYGTPGLNGSVIFVFPASDFLRDVGRRLPR